MAVSYTHLDVYKRQVHERSPIADMRLADGSRVHAILPPAAPDGPVLSIRKFTGIMPVSYTHLDVYKRQYLICVKLKHPLPSSYPEKGSCLG